MARVGLYFGTFDPIHVGHLIIANHFAHTDQIDQVWMVVSPLNPFKEKGRVLADHHRLAMVKEAIEDNLLLKASDVEFKMPQPSYTVDTVTYLEEKYPEHEFSLLMGEDNLASFHKWKNHEILAEKCQLMVFPRTGEAKDYPYRHHPKVTLIDMPMMQISSSAIRKAVKTGGDIRYLVTEPVRKYIAEMHFYK